MGWIEVTTDVSNCNASQSMNAPIYGAQGATITFGDIDCSKELKNQGGKTDLNVGFKLNLMNLGL